MGRRKQYCLVDAYDELTLFGHTDIWMREVTPPNLHKRLLISWDNNVLASYKPVLDCWYFCRKAQLVNANPYSLCPPGPGLTLLDHELAICLLTLWY